MASQQLQMMTFVHVFQSCNQENSTVLAIMEDVISKLKAIMPSLKTVTYRQENPGCYRSGEVIIGGAKAGKSHGVSVKQLDFSDPQGGKGACDRKSATIKAHMKVHLNEGNNIEDASHMVNAMQSSGGVPGLNVTSCEIATPKTSVKFDGISAVSNVKCGEDSLTMWKAYGIGPGKIVKLSQLTGENNNAPLPRLSSTMTEELSDKFTSSKSRSTKPETKSSSDEQKKPKPNQLCLTRVAHNSLATDKPVALEFPILPILQLLRSYSSALKRGVSNRISGFLLYRCTWTVENTNAPWNARHCWTKLYVAMPLDLKSSLTVCHSCSSPPQI